MSASYPKPRLPRSEHFSRPWRIHEIADGFRLEDVWALPAVGGRGDFDRLVRLIATGFSASSSSLTVRMLFAVRWTIGRLFGWDQQDAGLGSRVPTLRTLLPVDMREAAAGPDFGELPFTSLYLLDDEWAAEIANRTMHGIIHLGWVPDGAGGYRGQMAILVKPAGLLGRVYMAAIRPIRHVVVYPEMLQTIERRWDAARPPG